MPLVRPGMVIFELPPLRCGLQSFFAQTVMVWLPVSASTIFSLKVTDTLSPLSPRPATQAAPTGVQFDEATDETVGAVLSTVTGIDPGELTVAAPTVAVAGTACRPPGGCEPL